MTVYVILGLERFGPDWFIYETVFSNRKEAEVVCDQLNSGITGYEYLIEEKKFK